MEYGHRNDERAVRKCRRSLLQGSEFVVKILIIQMHYEQLVLHPEAEMRKLLDFLDLPWNSTVLRHEELIGSEIKLSNVERSSDQVPILRNLN